MKHHHPLSQIGFSVLLLTLILSEPLVAQPSSSSFDEVIDVEVANLDVYVTDKKGRPVTGLSPDDFQLYADGKPVKITNFYAVENGSRKAGNGIDYAPEAPEATTQDSGGDPLFLVIYVDNVHLGQFTRNRLVEELRPFLKGRHKEGDQIMVVSYDGRVRMQQSFTRKWGDITMALDRVSKEQGLGQLAESAHQQVIDDMLLRSDTQRYLKGRAQALATKCPAEMGEMAKHHAGQILGQVEASVDSLSAFIDTLANLPGRKALLHVSDGLPFQPGAEVFEFLFQFCGGAGAESIEHQPFNPDNFTSDETGGGLVAAESGGNQLGHSYLPEQAQLDASKFHTGSLFEGLTSKANASRVTFFTFEAYGPRNFATSNASVGRRRAAPRRVDEIRRASLQDSLFIMAERTGGQAILDTTQFTPALEKIGQDFESYYSLGYTLEGSEGRSVKVKVEVERKGAQLRYRKSLRSRSQFEDLTGRTQAALLYGQVTNPLGIVVRFGSSLPMDDGMRMVPIQVRIPIGKIVLLPEKGNHQGRLTLFLTGRDQDGKTTPMRTVPVPIKVPADQLEIAKARVYVYEVKMLMRPGEHTVAVGVHDDIASVASFTTEGFVVEDGEMPLASVGSQG